MLVGNPLWRVLGASGRAEVAEFLMARPTETFTLRAIALQTEAPLNSVKRAVHDWAELGLVESIRLGRDSHIRWVVGHPLDNLLRNLPSPERAWAAEFEKLLAGNHRNPCYIQLIAPTGLRLTHDPSDSEVVESAAADLGGMGATPIFMEELEGVGPGMEIP